MEVRSNSKASNRFDGVFGQENCFIFDRFANVQQDRLSTIVAHQIRETIKLFLVVLVILPTFQNYAFTVCKEINVILLMRPDFTAVRSPLKRKTQRVFLCF